MWSGLRPRDVAELDEDEYEALLDAVAERRRAASWGNAHEAIASAVEALWAILSRLEAGIATQPVTRLATPEDRGEYPRPEWLGLEYEDVPDRRDDSSTEYVTTSLREAITMMRRGG